MTERDVRGRMWDAEQNRAFARRRAIWRRVAIDGACCVLVALATVFASALFGGCAQNTEAPVSQATDQATVAPASNEQEQATQGSQVYVWIENAPAARSPSPGAAILDANGGFRASAMRSANAAGGNEVADAKAGYLQSGITVNITTGGTTPSATGTSTASATGTQTASAAPTVAPTQEVKPGISIPVGVALPGGMVDQQATATAEGSTSGTSKTSENRLSWSQVRALRDQLSEWLARNPPPATQPAE